MTLFERVTIVGLGLIGGSLARALRRASLCGSIAAYGRREAALRQAVEQGIIDRYSLDVREAARGADLVVLATPLSTTEPLLRTLNDVLQPGAIITDVGSAKGVVVAAARAALAPERLALLVPAHPIAGTEQSGVEASCAELFEDHVTIITPLAESNRDAVQRITRMWQGVGARVVELGVEHHDEVLAATSHLPHVLVYTLIDCLARMQDKEEIFAYAAGGFADFTRVASSSPEMWRDICLANADSLLTVLDRFEGHLHDARQAIAAADGDSLLEIFTRAKQSRDDFARTRGR